MALHTEQIEELLELCWTAEENNLAWLDRGRLPDHLRCFLPHPVGSDDGSTQQTLEEMVRQGLLLSEGQRIRLSPAGSGRAREVVRRHRLTEVLLSSLLDVSEQSMESTACQVEHILNAEVTEAVCGFLGHPPVCPHGCPIPSGRCCASADSTLRPLIVPLNRLAIGEEAKVAFIHTQRRDYLQRLSALGLAPGKPIHLRQTRPTLVVRLGETDLALDYQAGQEIFVRPRR
jgi:DtxR family transcriptional regulator, Mn-dependent transcriptional regulator